MACPAFLVFTLFQDGPFDLCEVRLLCSADLHCPLVWLAKKGVFILPEYIQEKRIRLSWPTASLGNFFRFSCALKASPIYVLKTVSCNSALLSNPFHFLTSIYIWTTVIIYNPASVWTAVPLSSIFQLAFLGAGPKTAGLLQALFWFQGAGWAFS